MARVTHLPELSALSEMHPFHDIESDKDTNYIFLQPFIFNARVTGIFFSCYGSQCCSRGVIPWNWSVLWESSVDRSGLTLCVL